MSLSHHERRELSRIDRALSAEPALRAVAGLFPGPPRPVAVPRRGPVTRLDRALGRHPTWYALIGVVVAALGLVCVALATAVRLEAVAVVGGVAAVAATVLLVVTIVRHGAGTDPAAGAFAGPPPTSTRRGDLA